VTQFWRKYIKGQGHTGTYCVQLKYALTQYRVIRSTSYSGADMRTIPRVGLKMVAMATLVD